MDFYVITPLEQSKWMVLGDRIFVLAQHWFESSKYRKNILKFKSQGKFITLDNGAGDGVVPDEDMIVEVCKELEPDEVVAPDFLFQKNKTLRALDKFLDRVVKEGIKSKIFAVPQGESIIEWKNCYMNMALNPYVDVIGMSKLAIPYAWYGSVADDERIMKSRIEATNWILDRPATLLTKPLHYLGCGHVDELKYYASLNNPFLRSTDSCFAYLEAIHNTKLDDKDYMRHPTPKNYFHLNIEDEETIKGFVHNVAVLYKTLH